MAIVAVALNRYAAGFANSMLQRGSGLFLWRAGASHVENFFFHDRPVQIVHAVAQGDLRERKAHADPVGSEVVEVVEVYAADRQIAQLLDR